MNDTPHEWTRGEFVITTSRERLDIDAALALLRKTFWGGTMVRDTLRRAAENSVCFGIYRDGELVGFARAVSDLATFAYLTDVVVDERYRKRGLGRWLTECIISHPELQGFRRIALLTRDAQALYAQCGFTLGAGVQNYMERAGGSAVGDP